MMQDHEGLEASQNCTLSGSSCKNLPVWQSWKIDEHLELLCVYKHARTSQARMQNQPLKADTVGNWRSRIAGVRIATIIRSTKFAPNLHWPDVDSISRASSFPSGDTPSCKVWKSSSLGHVTLWWWDMIDQMHANKVLRLASWLSEAHTIGL